MDHTALLIAQLSDILRIGLIAGLIYTMERTKAQTGFLVPMLAGLVFVAVVVASTQVIAGVDTIRAILSGIVANAVIFAVLWTIWQAIQKATAK